MNDTSFSSKTKLFFLIILDRDSFSSLFSSIGKSFFPAIVSEKIELDLLKDSSSCSILFFL